VLLCHKEGSQVGRKEVVVASRGLNQYGRTRLYFGARVGFGGIVFFLWWCCGDYWDVMVSQICENSLV